KKHDVYGIGNLEKALLKLGKEIQLTLDKLITYKIENPEVIGLLIEGKSRSLHLSSYYQND
ncbi:MAG: hypothetical protein EXX96DRAFT_492388, partial [Benjaminiella poitrasii]